ncbi:MAG: ATP cone domain-containing protein [Candidatus Micrarchaeia archaeon]
MKVKRKDGKEEEFVREKIVVAIVKSGGTLEDARAIAKEIENAFIGRDAVTTDEIRTEALKRLKDRDVTAYNSWIEYDRAKKGK